MRHDPHAPRPHPSILRYVLLLLIGLSFSTAQAHDTTHSHATDTRITPRDAATHITGTLPPASGGSTTAAPLVLSEIREGYRYVSTNGIPNHATGRFPNRGNPNVITEQAYHFRIPLDPDPPTRSIDGPDAIHTDRGYLFGLALNGVPFEPATGLNWTSEGLRRGGRPGDWVHEAIGGSINFGIDHANAHVQRTGAYHYHGIPTPLIHEDRPTLLGYAADGYPIYGPLGYQDPNNPHSPLVELQSSWQLKTSTRPGPPDGPGGQADGRYTADWTYQKGSGDLDYLNGRYAVTPEYPKGVYHYVLTEQFPHVPRGFAASPDASFRRLPGQGPNHVNQRGQRIAIGDR
ncbi:MAG: YHYH protein [Opitutales bacterium]